MKAKIRAWALVWPMLTGSALAQQCDPDKFLKTETFQSVSNLYVFFSLVDQFDQYSSDSQKANAKFIYKGVPIGFDAARSVVSKFSANTELKYQRIESQSIVKTQLSGIGLEAYRACLGAQSPLTIIMNPSAIEEEEFAFKVVWRPAGGGDEQKLRLRGIYVALDLKETMVKPNQEITVIGKRDLSRNATIVAEIGGLSESIMLPRKPPKTIQIMTFKSKKYVGELSNWQLPRSGDVCIPADDELSSNPRLWTDTVLFPSTLTVETAKWNHPGDSHANLKPMVGENNSSHVCGSYFQDQTHTNGQSDFSGFSVQFTVQGARLISN